jgi:hypothetical protein
MMAPAPNLASSYIDPIAPVQISLPELFLLLSRKLYPTINWRHSKPAFAVVTDCWHVGCRTISVVATEQVAAH